jgi:hypothetical protein
MGFLRRYRGLAIFLARFRGHVERWEGHPSRPTSILAKMATRAIQLEGLSTSDLFLTYRGILKELTRRGIVRTGNAPAGDYAEYLVAAMVRGELADNSEKSWDVKTQDGKRYQVKCRVVTDPRKPGERQLSPFRTWDFDEAVVVLFDDDYRVWRCVSLPCELMKERATYRKHVNGFVTRATDELLSHPRAVDYSDDLRRVAEGL